jgi:hypothetical protein
MRWRRVYGVLLFVAGVVSWALVLREFELTGRTWFVLPFDIIVPGRTAQGSQDAYGQHLRSAAVVLAIAGLLLMAGRSRRAQWMVGIGRGCSLRAGPPSPLLAPSSGPPG